MVDVKDERDQGAEAPTCPVIGVTGRALSTNPDLHPTYRTLRTTSPLKSRAEVIAAVKEGSAFAKVHVQLLVKGRLRSRASSSRACGPCFDFVRIRMDPAPSLYITPSAASAGSGRGTSALEQKK
jgi:hypothetical protein